MSRGVMAGGWGLKCEQARYAAGVYAWAPVTFLRRIVVGRDPYWQQYFYSRWGAVPAQVRQRLDGRRPLWVIARSGGEVTQAGTLCRLLARRFPDRPIVFSTQTADTYRAAQRLEGVAAVLDHPWDIGWVVRRVLAALSPAAVVCIENATYPVLLASARGLGVPTLIVSGFMSRSWEAHPMASRPMRMAFWRDLGRIGAKTEDDRREFLRLGVPPERVAVTGNLKYDAVQTAMTAEEAARWRRLFGFDDGAPVLIGGSISEGEVGFLLEAYRRALEQVPGLRLLVAPRYTATVPRIEEEAARLGLPTVRRSQLNHEGERRREEGGDAEGRRQKAEGLGLMSHVSSLESRIVILDSFGELPRLYALGAAVFLGATIAPINAMRYGQNLIEPLLHRKPVFFGPYHRHWEEETAVLRQVWPGLAVATAEELARRLTELLADASLTVRIAEAAERLTAPHRDAAARTVEFIEHVLVNGQGSPHRLVRPTEARLRSADSLRSPARFVLLRWAKQNGGGRGRFRESGRAVHLARSPAFEQSKERV